jgi:hypothetical protein
MVKYLITLSTMIFLTACGNEESNTCPATIDVVTELASEDGFFVYKRISGFSDKTRIIEIYNKKPTFDKCHMPESPPVFEDSIEIEGYIKSISFLRSENKINVEYSEDKVNPPSVFIKD